MLHENSNYLITRLTFSNLDIIHLIISRGYIIVQILKEWAKLLQCLYVIFCRQIIMDNAVAREVQNAHKLQRCSELIGEPLEISVIRREDFKNHRGKGEGDDLIQGAQKSKPFMRGHQSAGAFLIMASGLDKVKLDSCSKNKSIFV